MDSSGESLFSNSFYDFNFFDSCDELCYNLEPLVTQDIFTAANVGNKEVVYNLISNKPYLAAAKNIESWNALMYATYFNHQDIVLFLLEKNAPLHACNGKGQNVLMIAASVGFENLVEQYLNMGSNIESRDEKDWTPLLYAVTYSYLKVVKVLLKYGANPNALVRNTGRTPLISAVFNGNIHLVKMLLSAGAYPDFKDYYGKDALSYAIEIGDRNVIAILENFCSKDGYCVVDVGKQITFKLNGTNSTGKEQNGYDAKYGSFLSPSYDVGKQTTLFKFNGTNSTDDHTLSSFSPRLESVLMHYGLSSYIPLFQQNAIDLLLFLGLSDKDLKECGVSELGARRKMLDIISKWHHNTFYSKGSVTSPHEIKLLTEILELREQLSEFKQKKQDCESVIVELRRRLQECHKLSYLLRDNLMRTLQLILPITKVAEIFTKFFSFFEDLIHLTSDVGSDFHMRN